MTSFVPITEFAPDIQAAFERAGWHPGRITTEFDDIRRPPAIQALLREIGGLTVLANKRLFFNPMASSGRKYDWYEELLGRRLYSIGHTSDHWSVCVDEHGSVYLLADWLELVGYTFREGLTALLRATSRETSLEFDEDTRTWGPDELTITWPDFPPHA